MSVCHSPDESLESEQKTYDSVVRCASEKSGFFSAAVNVDLFHNHWSRKMHQSKQTSSSEANERRLCLLTHRARQSMLYLQMSSWKYIWLRAVCIRLDRLY